MTAPMKAPFGKGAPQPIPQVIYNPDLNATLGGMADHLIFQSAFAHWLKVNPTGPFLDSLNVTLDALATHQERIPEWVQEQRAKMQAEYEAEQARLAEAEAVEPEPARG